MNQSTAAVLTPLVDRRCTERLPKATALEISEWSKSIPGWKIEKKELTRQVDFNNYHQTMAFVNALAWISHAENHHPDLIVKYSACVVSYSTHSLDGLSENDFICAAKLNRLLHDSPSC